MGLFGKKKKEEQKEEVQKKENAAATEVSGKYLMYRQQILDATSQDINITLNRDDQIYIAVFDIPDESGGVGLNTKTLGLVFSLNTNLYFANGMVWAGLESNPAVMEAMMSLMVSAAQVLDKMQPVNRTDYYNSKNVRVYLKTRTGTHFKELDPKVREDAFLLMLMNRVISAIADTPKDTFRIVV